MQLAAGIDRVVQVKEGHKYLKEVQRRAIEAKELAKKARASPFARLLSQNRRTDIRSCEFCDTAKHTYAWNQPRVR